MIRRPPRSTLFPYTNALPISAPSSARNASPRFLAAAATRASGARARDLRTDPARAAGRSEEHTSELQSLAYLVCRLLLEKKKQNDSDEITTNTGVTTCIHART